MVARSGCIDNLVGTSDILSQERVANALEWDKVNIPPAKHCLEFIHHRDDIVAGFMAGLEFVQNINVAVRTEIFAKH